MDFSKALALLHKADARLMGFTIRGDARLGDKGHKSKKWQK